MANLSNGAPPALKKRSMNVRQVIQRGSFGVVGREPAEDDGRAEELAYLIAG